MVQAIALQELKNSGKIVGYKLKDETGQIMDIKTSAIVDAMRKNLINISNLTITSSGDLVMKKEEKKATEKHVDNQPEVKQETSKQVEIIENYEEDTPQIKYMRKLINDLNAATKVYEQGKDEIMSNNEWDKLYDELVALEAETGTVLANSPTVNVGYEIVSNLPKEKHSTRMLSLEKTKSIDDLKSFLGNKEGVLSWKLDGLTVVLTYEDGTLVKAVTRGNGEVGEVVTPNVKQFTNVPRHIALPGSLVIRGEAVIKYSTFEKINANITSEDDKYKNPRNLCSGSVRQLDSKITAQRSVEWHCFEVVESTAKKLPNEYDKQLGLMKTLGFDIVENYVVTADNIEDVIKQFSNKITAGYDIPSDGLVLTFRDREYGKSLGSTAKTPRHSKAFKWKDEIAETTLLDIEWSPSRTGLINPIAIFEPVELEGTTVSRASLHNISILDETLGRPYVGQQIGVYKANMIIPCIAWGEKIEDLEE